MESLKVYAKSSAAQATTKVVIKDFVELMSASEPKNCYPSEIFMIGDTPMVLNVYPNGNTAAHKGHVSVFLKALAEPVATVKCKITTDLRTSKFEHLMEPDKCKGEWGYAEFLTHDQCVHEYKDKDFVVTASIGGLAWGGHGQKSPVEPNEPRVWENVYTNMERTDFTLVFDGQEVPCHKHVLAAASPVLRAMVENQHTEAITSKANFELSEEVGRACVRFIYTGKLDESLLKEHAPSFLELGEMYDLRELKDMAEGELMKRLDKKTMVTLLSIAEIFRAGELFEAALKMTKINISWLRSQV